MLGLNESANVFRRVAPILYRRSEVYNKLKSFLFHPPPSEVLVSSMLLIFEPFNALLLSNAWAPITQVINRTLKLVCCNEPESYGGFDNDTSASSTHGPNLAQLRASFGPVINRLGLQSRIYPVSVPFGPDLAQFWPSSGRGSELALILDSSPSLSYCR